MSIAVAANRFHVIDEAFPGANSVAWFVQHYKETTQQGTFESKYRDLMIMFSDWPFTPMTLENPFDTPVHIWQGTEDTVVPANLQKYVADSLPWVQYHELQGDGHILNAYPGMAEKIVRTLLEASNKKDFKL